MQAYDIRSRRWEKNIRVPFVWRTDNFPDSHMQARGKVNIVAWCPFFELSRPVKRKAYVFVKPNGEKCNYSYPSKHARLMHKRGVFCVACHAQAAYYVLVHDIGKYMVWILNEHGELFTLDHHIPRSKGGTNRSVNLNVMCAVCNQKKADTHPEEA